MPIECSKLIPRTSPQRLANRLSASEVFGVCKRFVYPPCKKLAGSVRLTDRLVADLGYIGDSTALLALKTNQAFQMAGPESFTSLDFCVLHTVQDHVVAVCTKLARAGRLVTG